MADPLLPITLTARRGNWQRFSQRKDNPAFIKVRDKIFARDNHTCRFCGFHALKYQEVVNIDHNYANNVEANLATACSLCMPCFFLDAVGTDGRSGGVIIHLPEISQAALNNFIRALFCSLLRDTPYKGKLQAVYLSLHDRSKTLETVFGPHSEQPHLFGESIIDAELTPQQLQHPLLSELKFLPTRKIYKTQAEYWKQTVFANIPL